MNPNLDTDRLPSRRNMLALTASILLLVSSVNVFSQPRSRPLQNPTSGDPVPKILLLRILRAEDERRWDDDLRGLFSARNAAVRSRAALAAGRIGDEKAVGDLITLLQRDDETYVRAMAAFALGEIESPSAAAALMTSLKDAKEPPVRARAVEALGKIAGALPKETKEEKERVQELGGPILEALTVESRRGSAANRLTVLLALTATLRANPANAGPIVARFLQNSDPRIRADAASTLARLKLKDGNDELRNLITSDPDPVVRANAARVLGATEDQASFAPLLNRALKDKDSRVRVSSIRALASLAGASQLAAMLRDGPATAALMKRGDELVALQGAAKNNRTSQAYRGQANELLEIASALGRLKKDANSEMVMIWLGRVRPITGPAPEIEIALARIYPSQYVTGIMDQAVESMFIDWRAASSLAQGLGEMAEIPKTDKITRPFAEDTLRKMLDYRNSGININTLVAVHTENAVPDVLQAFAEFEPKDLGEVLRKNLKESDVIVRAKAAELLGKLPPDETNTGALTTALPVALADKELNDAALAILDSLAKQKNTKANDAIKSALDSQDHLVRRKAVALLKVNGAGDFSSRIGTVQTRNTAEDYERAIGRMGKQVSARVTTSRGSFTIDLLPDEATLNVDNFIQLAQRKYFNGVTVHRVVPNFVIQDGDPRGDGNGGPGYQIRCEINQVPYERGAVGMALSGKDTGGSQWFVTHSPQPHLDGGYTVFGNVVSGMDTVDAIVRGDVISSIVITESTRRRTGRAQPGHAINLAAVPTRSVPPRGWVAADSSATRRH